MIPAKIFSPKGYSIAKTAVSASQKEQLERELTVKPNVPATYAATATAFRLWLESPARYYLPNAYGRRIFGEPESDIRAEGVGLPPHLRFMGELRPHQVEALSAFRRAGRNGIICLPCGYGKTFTGIAAATSDPEVENKCFLIVVHKEFLADQWSEELTKLVPGIRIGRIQGEKCEIGADVDVAIAMIQTICSRAYPVGTFDRFGFAIFDEVHHLGAEHFSQALQRINCRRMLGLTATPKRADGLSKVFEHHLGAIVYQIARRPKDDTVLVEVYRYTSDDPAYCDVPTNWKGETIRAHLLNKIAGFRPRTVELVNWIRPLMDVEERQLLILSDRREHLVEYERLFRSSGIDSIGYYVGGMKQKDLDISATKRILLGTFAMASEGMNIPSLNMVHLGTPKSNIEQSVGRILRLKKEERKVQPMILDVLDEAFAECNGQYRKRLRFYKECGYSVKLYGDESSSDSEEEEPKTKEKKPLFVEDEDDSTLPTVLDVILCHDARMSKPKKRSADAGAKKKGLFVDEDD